jgi:hypothetical protein
VLGPVKAALRRLRLVERLERLGISPEQFRRFDELAPGVPPRRRGARWAFDPGHRCLRETVKALCQEARAG